MPLRRADAIYVSAETSFFFPLELFEAIVFLHLGLALTSPTHGTPNAAIPVSDSVRGDEVSKLFFA